MWQSFRLKFFTGEILTSGQKISVSLLISVIAFAFFAVLSLSGQFEYIEAKFYQPAVRRPVEQKVTELAENEKQYNQILIDRFAFFLSNDSILSSTKSKADNSIVRERENLWAKLKVDSPYLLSLRIVDSNGRKIHFSTFDSDKKKQDDRKIIYEDYSKLVLNGEEIEFDSLNCPQDKKFKIFNDKSQNRIIYALPFIGKDDSDKAVLNATALFYCSAQDFLRFVYSKNLLSISEKDDAEYFFTGLSNAGGYVFGLPHPGSQLSVNGIDALKDSITKKIKSNIQERISGNLNFAGLNSFNVIEDTVSVTGTYSIVDKVNSLTEQIELEQNEYSTDALEEQKNLSSTYNFVLFTKIVDLGENSFGFITFVCNAEDFKVSDALRILLLALVFLTLFLSIFLILNLKRDDMVVIKDRIRRFQSAFIAAYKKQSKKIPADLKKRKGEFEQEIKKSLGRRAKKYSQQVEELLEQSWAEILAATGEKESPEQKEATNAKIDSKELKNVLEEILNSGKLNIKVESTPTAQIQPQKAEQPALTTAEPVEDLDEVDDAEPAEELEEVDDAEPAEELEEVEDAEPAEELEEIEDAEQAEELEEVDYAEPAEELEEVEDAEPAEDLEEVDDAEPAEDLEEAEDAEPVEDLDEVEDAEPAEELEEAEPADELEEVDDAEPVEDLEEAEDVEPAEEIDEVEDAEPVEDLEEVDDAEPAEDLDEVEDTEPAEELEEAEDAESAEDLEEVDDAEPAEELEELTDTDTSSVSTPAPAAPVSDVKNETTDVDISEFLDDVDLLNDGQPSEKNTAPTEPVEPADKLEEIADAEPAEPAEPAESPKDDADFEEEIGFGVPSPLPQSGSEPLPENDATDDFVVAPVDFSFLDNETENQESGIVQPQTLNSAPSADSAPTDDFTDNSPDNANTSDFATAQTEPKDLLQQQNTTQEREEKTLQTTNFTETDYTSFTPEYLPPVVDLLSALDSLSEPEIPAETEPEEEMSLVLEENSAFDDGLEEPNPENAGELETLSTPFAAQPFMFAKLGAETDNVEDLVPLNSKAIVEAEDGTFYIQGEPDTSDVVLDSTLKTLVESVLK